MVFPKSNLPPLDGQRDYMLVQRVQLGLAPHMFNICSTDPFIVPHRYTGYSISALRHISNAAIQTSYQQYEIYDYYNQYIVKFSDAQEGVIMYRSNIAAQTTVPRNILKQLQAITYYAIDPLNRAEAIQRFLNVAYMPTAHVRNISDAEVAMATAVIHVTLDEAINPFNHIDREHVSVLLSPTRMTHNIAEHLNAYVNNTYVNIVHDCNTACSQAVLSDKRNFMSLNAVANYGMLCAHRILELNNVSQHTTTMLTTAATQTTESTTRQTTVQYDNTTMQTTARSENTTIQTTESTTKYSTIYTTPNTTLHHTAVSTTQSKPVYVECIKCEECTVNLLPSGFNAAIVTFSAIALFVAYSKNKYVIRVRRCISRMGHTIHSRIQNLGTHISQWASTICALRRTQTSHASIREVSATKNNTLSANSALNMEQVELKFTVQEAFEDADTYDLDDLNNHSYRHMKVLQMTYTEDM